MSQLKETFKAFIFFGLLLSMLSIFLLPTSTGQREKIFIHLKSGSFDPLHDAHTLQMWSETNLLLVQMKGPIMPDWKKELQEIGRCEILWYIPDYTFLIKTKDFSTLEKIRNLSYVRWAGPYLPQYKIHPDLLQKWGDVFVRVVMIENSLIGRVNKSDLLALASLDEVLWIEPYTQPKIFNENARWVVQSGIYHFAPVHENGLHGENQLITIADTGIRITHEMFVDSENIGINHRKIRAYYVPEDAGGALGDESGHGTHVAGTVAGDAGTLFAYDVAKHDGHAFVARIVMQDIDSDSDPYIYPPDDFFKMFEPAYDVGSLIHTNSWGGGSGYTSESQRIDNFLWLHKDFTILYGMGNSGPSSGTLSAQAEAKNVIAVGATKNGVSSNDIWYYSSRGPTQDNRIRPTVVAPGQFIWSANFEGDNLYIQKSGTSMSTPAVAGSVALIRQYYEEGWYPSGKRNPADAFEPSSALVKATLIAGAVEINGQYAYYNGYFYPNWDQGWGRVNLNNSLYFEGDNKRMWVVDNRLGISTGETATYFVNIIDNTQPLKFVLCWTDYPGSPSASIQLVNDLDLKVTDPNGNVYLGNVFAGYNPGFSVAGGSADRRNTEEAVILTPENNIFPTGIYKIEVIGYNVPMGEPETDAQPFALVVVGGISPEQPVIAPTFTWTQTTWDGGIKELEVGRFTRSYAWFYSAENIIWENSGKITLSPGSVSGWIESNIFDSHRTADWKNVRLIANKPPGSEIVIKLRTGMDNNPYDGGWTDWIVHQNGMENENLPSGRYLQYRLELFGSAPEIREISVTYIPTLLAPTFLYPSLGENIGENEFVISWTEVWSSSPPVLYRLWIDNDSDFSSVDVDSGWIENTTWALTSPLPDGIWYARIQARDNVGFLSENSEIWFRVDTVNPPPPVLLNPLEGENTNNVTPIFSWQSVVENSLPVLYLVSISDNYEFPYENISSEWISNNQWTSPSLGDGVWYWRVKARDNAGNEGDWSEIRSFRVDTVPPNAPNLISPLDNEVVSTSAPILVWQGVQENSLPVMYLVAVSDDPLFQHENRSSGWILSTSWVLTPPLPNGRYYWKVKARDNAGNEGVWSGQRSFTIDTTPPSSPSLLLPFNNSSTRSSTVTFSWSEVLDDSPPISYMISISKNPNFSPEVWNSGWISAISWSATLSDGTWFWRVKAKDFAGNESFWSQIFVLNVDTTPPPVPSPIFPPQNYIISSSSPVFEWAGVSDFSPPVSYLLQISDVDTFAHENRTSGWIQQTSWQVSPPLSDGVWFWRVKAKDGLGNESGWSPTMRIIVDTIPPEKPTIFSSTHAEGVPSSNRNVLFHWSTVGGPSSVVYFYRLDNYDNEWKQTTETNVSYQDLPDGVFTFLLKAKDAGGESETGKYSIIVDTVPPDIEIFGLENENRLKSSSRIFTLKGRVEPGSTIEIDNLRALADENGIFNVDLQLSEGLNLFLLKIVDRAGNVTERQLVVEWPGPSWVQKYKIVIFIGCVSIAALAVFWKIYRLPRMKRRKRKRRSSR